MKFLSSATTAAMAGLLLLVSAANGEGFYECYNKEKFYLSEVIVKAVYATVGKSGTIEPHVPLSATRISHEFEVKKEGKDKEWYLVQYCELSKKYYLFRLGGSDWEPCEYHEE